MKHKKKVYFLSPLFDFVDIVVVWKLFIGKRQKLLKFSCWNIKLSFYYFSEALESETRNGKLTSNQLNLPLRFYFFFASFGVNVSRGETYKFTQFVFNVKVTAFSLSEKDLEKHKFEREIEDRKKL